MFNRIRSRLSYANVIASLALFLALGGTSYAVHQIGSSQIRNNSIRSRDIRNNDIRSRDIRNHSLFRKDFKRGQLHRGVGSYVVAHTTSNRTSGRKDVTATCPPGMVVLGGGGVAFGAPVNRTALEYSIPANPPNRWRVGATEVNGGTASGWALTAYAICARAG